MSRPEEQLACAIARHHFGPIIGEVVRLLMLQPGCTVMNLLAETETFFQKLYSDNHQGTGRNGSRNSGNNTITANRDVWMKQALAGGVITSYQPSERLRLLRDALAVLLQHDLCFAREAVGSSSIPASSGAPAGASSSALNHGNTNANGDANGTAKTKATGPSSPGSPSNKSKTVPFEYFIMIDRLMCRSRIPLYIGFARLRFGSVGEIVVRTLFLRGRMTSHMMFAVALDKALPRLGVSVSDAEACLTDMARSGLLKWSCRRFSRRLRKQRLLLKRRAVGNDADIHGNGLNSNGESSINSPSATQGVKRRRTGSTNDTGDAGNGVGVGGGSTGSDADDEKPASTAVLSIDYADPEIMSDSDDDSDDDSDMSDDDEQRVTVGRGDSRRKVGAPAHDNDTDVWTICYWQLNREFRNECCVKVAQTRVDDDVACSILRIGLQLALEEEDSVRPSEDFETADIATEDIQKVFEQRDSTLSASTFWEGVQVLVNQTPSFVLPIPEHAPTKLRFVPGRLIAEAREKTLEEFIGMRYQPAGRRVFQALAMEGGMVEKMLADKCLLHVKVVRALVYKLYEDNLVCLQEVSRSHDTGTRSNNWFYLWKVNIMAALRNVIQVMYQTSANLFVRLESMDRLHAKYKRNRKSKEELRRIQAQRQVVLGNILRMDQSIMVMRDFGPLTATYFPSKFDPIDGPIGYVQKTR